MKEITFQEKQIFYRTEGNGQPLILLHGFAEDGNIWNFQVEKLKENFYVIVPDLPGSGQSEMLEGDISIEDYAEVIKAIADKEIIQARKNKERKNLLTLIGHSMGGYISLAFAEKYPELLNAFGLFHSTAYADDLAKKATRRKGIEFIRKNDVSTFIKSTTPNLFSEKTKKENPDVVETVITQYKNFSGEALIQYYEAMIRRPDRTSVLRSFRKPVLFIIGRQDTAVPLQSSLEQCYLPAVSYLHILKNSGHMGMLEDENAATAFLLNFLKGNNIFMH